ncbi:hypothetical protein B0T16DRAFT_324305 [Cercophora newfieldiana]|uniref:histidine kinase n=1 Tax=Cercophora newfieldiana TaxID=92897 RepID=A0AA39YCW4_9PEZI|nr:hypothetical protein B0T16DRAFT_324305 [Cercophora newfieldiana]
MLVDAEPCVDDVERQAKGEGEGGGNEQCEEVEEYERARQREIAAYLLAASFPMDLVEGPQEKPFLNSDQTLNALCQLGALRLNCRRSFISLIDRHYQWVVAETTRTHSIRQMKWEVDDDRLAFGVTKLQACWGVCPTTMKAFLDETGDWIRTGPNVIANNTRYIVNDFRTDPMYMERVYVKDFPWFVSYLEVPLVSPLGYLLGSYCVVHDDLKDYDNEDTVGIMNDIAVSIMVYLEGVRSKQNRHRSDELVAGLSNFIASDPSTTESHTATHTTQTPGEPPAPGRAPRMEVPEKGTSSSVTESADSTKQPRPSLPNLASASSVESSVSVASLPSRGDAEATPLTSLGDEYSQGLAEQLAGVEQTTHPEADEHAPNTPVSSGSENPEAHSSGFISSANIKSAFFRAARTIQQSMDLDGLVFLDAAPTMYVGPSDDSTVRDGGDCSESETAGPFCAAIVQSSAEQDGGSTPQPPPSRLPESTLQRLIRGFPNGHLFSADELGPIDESYAPGRAYPGMKAEPGSRQLRNDMITLFRVFPEAKYIVFLPLWHFQRECWYAATIGWVTDPTNALLPTDVGLLSAFGNSVMAEVSRMEAMAASRAKSSFVSSISHELRSPLHGILASSELLRASISDPALLSTLDMLDSCGRTLLDTFNNLLEHAITIKNGVEGFRSLTVSTTTPELTDLGDLVQDVVDAVHFSHLSERAFQSTLQRGRDGGNYTLPSGEHIVGSDSPLLVVLEIEKRDWMLPVDAGVWKRFIMNLFGNALKYTKTGRIEVSLRMLRKADGAGTVSDHICLKVEDSGRGISGDFLKYRLFTPFSQEDHYAPGIGLGLSIVHQLARSLGGNVDVKSSVGIGTVVEVCLPVNYASGKGIAIEPTSSSIAPNQQLYRRKLCLITDETYRVMTKTAGNEMGRKKSRRSILVERAIQVNACDSLGMTLIVASAGAPLPKADVYILDSDCFRQSVQDKANKCEIEIPCVSPLLLLCSGAGAPLCRQYDALREHGTHLHHPLGPKKLLSAILSALGTSRPGSVGAEGSSLPVSRLVLRPDIPLKPSGPEPEPEPESSKHETDLVGKAMAAETATGLAPPTPTILHLLLVDDNHININVLVAAVRRLKHTFVTASDGLEAVQQYKKALDEKRPFDMVWMDLQMPKMDGFEAIRQIRDFEATASIKGCEMIALTGLSSGDSKKLAMGSGASKFLTKPVKLAMIRGMLEEEVQKRQAGKGK